MYKCLSQRDIDLLSEQIPGFEELLASIKTAFETSRYMDAEHTLKQLMKLRHHHIFVEVLTLELNFRLVDSYMTSQHFRNALDLIEDIEINYFSKKSISPLFKAKDLHKLKTVATFKLAEKKIALNESAKEEIEACQQLVETQSATYFENAYFFLIDFYKKTSQLPRLIDLISSACMDDDEFFSSRSDEYIFDIIKFLDQYHIKKLLEKIEIQACDMSTSSVFLANAALVYNLLGDYKQEEKYLTLLLVNQQNDNKACTTAAVYSIRRFSISKSLAYFSFITDEEIYIPESFRHCLALHKRYSLLRANNLSGNHSGYFRHVSELVECGNELNNEIKNILVIELILLMQKEKNAELCAEIEMFAKAKAISLYNLIYSWLSDFQHNNIENACLNISIEKLLAKQNVSLIGLLDNNFVPSSLAAKSLKACSAYTIRNLPITLFNRTVPVELSAYIDEAHFLTEGYAAAHFDQDLFYLLRQTNLILTNCLNQQSKINDQQFKQIVNLIELFDYHLCKSIVISMDESLSIPETTALYFGRDEHEQIYVSYPRRPRHILSQDEVAEFIDLVNINYPDWSSRSYEVSYKVDKSFVTKMVHTFIGSAYYERYCSNSSIIFAEQVQLIHNLTLLNLNELSNKQYEMYNRIFKPFNIPAITNLQTEIHKTYATHCYDKAEFLIANGQHDEAFVIIKELGSLTSKYTPEYYRIINLNYQLPRDLYSTTELLTEIDTGLSAWEGLTFFFQLYYKVLQQISPSELHHLRQKLDQEIFILHFFTSNIESRLLQIKFTLMQAITLMAMSDHSTAITIFKNQLIQLEEINIFTPASTSNSLTLPQISSLDASKADKIKSRLNKAIHCLLGDCYLADRFLLEAIDSYQQGKLKLFPTEISVLTKQYLLWSRYNKQLDRIMPFLQSSVDTYLDLAKKFFLITFLINDNLKAADSRSTLPEPPSIVIDYLRQFGVLTEVKALVSSVRASKRSRDESNENDEERPYKKARTS